jgi:hypothetical protein
MPFTGPGGTIYPNSIQTSGAAAHLFPDELVDKLAIGQQGLRSNSAKHRAQLRLRNDRLPGEVRACFHAARTTTSDSCCSNTQCIRCP